MFLAGSIASRQYASAAGVDGITFVSDVFISNNNVGYIPAHNAGDLLVQFVSRGATTNASISTPTGWTKLDEDIFDGGSTSTRITVAVFYKVATVTAGAGTISGFTNATETCGIVYRPTGGAWDETALVGTANIANGSAMSWTSPGSGFKGVALYGRGNSTFGTMDSAVPSGFTHRSDQILSSPNCEVVNSDDLTSPPAGPYTYTLSFGMIWAAGAIGMK